MKNKNSKKKHSIKVLLIDDQIMIGEAVRRMLQSEPEIEFKFCAEPIKAVQIANQFCPTVILQDLIMPQIDGLTLLKFLRANPKTKQVPMIVLSSKEEPLVKADAFALGANDYIVKLPDKIELIARIKYHSAGYIHLLERDEAYKELLISQELLATELKEAADYVTSLLPEKLKGNISTDWKFIPSTSLGGDSFGYHWLDDDHFSMYLLDVCGHGVGAALLSVSAINVLRSQTLINTDFSNPGEVLENLNETFKMENQNNMYFTMWYGVYNKLTNKLSFSSGGHPPSVLVHAENDQVEHLKTGGMVIGGMPGMKFQTKEITIQANDKLFLFSDGVYEVTKLDNSMMEFDEFVQILVDFKNETNDVEKISQEIAIRNIVPSFDDDFSLVRFTFSF